MKKLILALLLVNAAIFWSGSANALETYTVDIDNEVFNVGEVDKFLVEGIKGANSNEATETAWVNDYFASTDTVEFIVKAEPVTYYSTSYSTSGVSTSGVSSTVFAFDLFESSDYFLIKDANNIALFQNLPENDWGVFDMDNLGSEWNLNDFTISHVTQFNSSTSVPEPSISALLGLGLLGMIGVARRKV